MTRFNTGGIPALLLALLFAACTDEHPRPEGDALQRKAAPYDQFSFQRSYPDRDFDWQGWRKAMARLRGEFKRMPAADNNDADWTLQGPGNVAGRVNALAIHPANDSIVLAGFSGGGIFKSTNAGVNWKPVFDEQLELAIGDITFDPSNPNIVYAGTGDPNIPAITFNGNGLYKSADAGETWQYVGLSQVGIISKVIVDPQNPATLFVGTMGNPYVRDADRGVYKSTDGGTTWQNVLFVSDQAGASDLVMHPTNPLILYASFWDRIRNNQESTLYGTHARVYKTTDGGTTWTPLAGGLPTGVMGRTGLAISQQNPEKIYAVYMDSLSTIGGLYKSIDGGQNWTTLNVVALEDACADFGWYFGKIRLNPQNDEEVYFLAILLWRKAAGSTQWQSAANAHADCHDLVFSPAGRRYLGTDGGVYRADPGKTSYVKSNNLPTTQFYHTSYNLHEPNNYYAGAQDNGIRRGNGSGYNAWESVFPADGFRCAFDPADPNVFWVETQNGEIHKTTDGGNTWQYGSPCLGTGDRCNWDLPYMMSPHKGGRLYAGTYRMYFAENGSGWGILSGDLTDGIVYGARFHNITCLDESPVLEGKLYAGTSDGNVWRREPAGTWANLSAGLPDRYVTSVLASPTLPTQLFVTHSGFRDNEYIPHVHRSSDNGQTWTDISGNLPNIPVNDIFVLPGHADSVLFVATDAGVYASLNAGQHWQRLGKILPFIPVFDLERNPVRNELIAATHARGLWTFPLDSVFTLTPPNSVAVTGFIRTEDGDGVNHVAVCDQPAVFTGTDGAYSLLFGAPCLTPGINPGRNDDPLNGVSTFDLVLINKHILGLDTLNSPYKMIAADANNSRSITTFDIVTLRKLILGIDTVFTNTHSWRFVPADYVFPNPANPFASVFPEGVDPALTAQPPAQPIPIDFIGLKVGDVNGSVTPALHDNAEERWQGEWPILVETRDFQPGDQVDVVFSTPQRGLAGIQFTVGFDERALTLNKITPVGPGMRMDHFAIKPGGKNSFTVCFDPPIPGVVNSKEGPAELFCARFTANTRGQLPESLQVQQAPTPAAAFKQTGEAFKPVFRWQEAQQPMKGVVFLPNPVGLEGTQLVLTAQVSTSVQVWIFDGSGKMIFQQKFGQSGVHVPGSVFPQNGIYYYEVRLEDKRFAGKLVYAGR